MKSILIGCLLITSIASAEPLQVTVRDFNFTYQNPQGEGTAASFSRSKLLEGVTVWVEKVDQDFLLKVTGAENTEFELKDAPSIMTEAESMDVSDFDLSLADRLVMGLKSGKFISPEDHLEIQSLSLNCQRDTSATEEMDQLINGCIKFMSLDVDRFSSESMEKALLLTLENSFNQVFVTNSVGVSSLDLTTSGGNYKFEADVKAQISGRVKSKGNISYNASQGLVSVKISEVKFGFFNITGKVFDELKKKENEKLRVSQPYVYLKIK